MDYIESLSPHRALEELDGPTISAIQCAIAEVNQLWSVIGSVTNNLPSRAPPYFGRHVTPLAPAAFAVVSTHQPALGSRDGLWLFILMCNPQGRPVPQQWEH
jgi:hypothetical protein